MVYDGGSRGMSVTKSVVRREIVLLVLLSAVAAIGFFFTRAIAADNRGTRLRDAETWAASADAALSGGRLSDAIDALRHAAALDRGNQVYGLTLASTLAADHQTDAAQQVLVGLRDRAPEDPAVNLQLARLAASGDDLQGAVRYYQNALYGFWPDEEEARRREIRVELVRMLIDHHEDSRALSELLVLSANLPDEPAAQIEAGRLFLDVGDPGRALDRFTRALSLDPKNGDATAGAGEAAFALADYARARDYLADAPADNARVAELRTIVDLVLSSDPLAARISSAARQRRVIAMFGQAAGRLDTCLAGPVPDPDPLRALKAEADAFRATIEEGTLRRSPDAVDTGFELAYRIEQATQAGCGPTEPLDQAILLVGRRHGLETS